MWGLLKDHNSLTQCAVLALVSRLPAIQVVVGAVSAGNFRGQPWPIWAEVASVTNARWGRTASYKHAVPDIFTDCTDDAIKPYPIDQIFFNNLFIFMNLYSFIQQLPFWGLNGNLLTKTIINFSPIYIKSISYFKDKKSQNQLIILSYIKLLTWQTHSATDQIRNDTGQTNIISLIRSTHWHQPDRHSDTGHTDTVTLDKLIEWHWYDWYTENDQTTNIKKVRSIVTLVELTQCHWLDD